jgi:prepilin-type N-terminal cleavage/methylation domain-containing protein/prepilin-type processing-associated H-X9-DG protein
MLQCWQPDAVRRWIMRVLALRDRRRAGFTLVELLVVIAIIGVLVALLLPAVQMARESARRSSCDNNAKQLGLGAHNFIDIRGFVPPSRLANASADATTNWVTWSVILLPYIEQQNYFTQWDVTTAYERHPVTVTRIGVPTYFCPSRRRPSQAYSNDNPSGGLSDYAAAAGRGPNDGVNASGVLNANANGAMICALWVLDSTQTKIVEWKGAIRLATITDGTSNTFLLGEKHVRRTTKFGQGEDRSVYTSGNANNYRRYAGRDNTDPNNIHYTICKYVNDVQFTTQAIDNRCFGSWHPAGCHFTFCDGSVRFVKENTDIDTLGRLAQIDDGLTISGEY